MGSNENRAIITDFIRRKSKVGGRVALATTLCRAGQPLSPIRHMLTEHDHMHMAAAVKESANVSKLLSSLRKIF